MQPTSLTAQAFAKINWDLRILGKRPDNFHELDSVFTTINLYDTLIFAKASTLSLTCTDPELPVDSSNLILKAAEVLRKSTSKTLGAKIHLDKKIPMGGGLGGGSSDAACTIWTLNRLWHLNLNLDQLVAIAAQVGSDVAYFLYGGWCLCRGHGEVVQRLPNSEGWPPVKILLILPPLHVATPLVYKTMKAPLWDPKGGDSTGGRDSESVGTQLGATLESIFKGTLNALNLRNDLTAPAVQVEPRLDAIQKILQRYYPDRWLMSGSGASHFAIPLQSNAASNLEALTAHLREAVPGTRVIETETIF